MASRVSSYIVSFFRQNPSTIRQNPGTQIRKLTIESKESDFISEDVKSDQCQENPCEKDQNFAEIAKEVSKITRMESRWEQTLISNYPSFIFADPRLFCEFLKHQSNVFLSLKFFQWLHLHYGCVPDKVSCRVLFDSLLDAKACNAAKCFLELSGFSPGLGSLERYIQCLCESRFVQEALDMLEKFKVLGVCVSVKTWNLALLGCLKVGRTDLLFKLYHDMSESGVATNVETVECLIQAFCIDGKLMEGYRLLRQVLEDGFELRSVAFNKLISEFSKEGNYDRVSELLHIMIAKHHPPDLYTYHGVINGLCKRKMSSEALRIFYDLKDRGYAPNRVMYKTMIHGLCKAKQIGDARKLWFEMVKEGILPDEYTYNSMIYGYCKVGHFEEAKKLYNDMCYAGYPENIVSYNTIISWLSLHGRLNEALDLFKEMPKKGIVRDVCSYNALIQGFCKKGRIVDSIKIFNQLLLSGLRPSISCCTSLIKSLCLVGEVQEAKKLWDDTKSGGLKLITGVHDLSHYLTVSKGMQEKA